MLRALIIAAAFVVAAGCGSSGAKFNSTDITGANYGGELHLTDHTGKPRTLADFRGKVVALFFGYTFCPDVCPTTLAEMKSVLARLGDDAKRVQVLFVTVDPERDTPALLARYVTAFDPGFLGLYGDADATAQAARSFRVFYEKVPGSSPKTYSINHTAGTYLIDPQGRLRLFVRYGQDVDATAADIRLLLQGK